MTVVDLGAAPGSWTQVVRKRLSASDGTVRGRILALDILPMDPVPDVDFIQGTSAKRRWNNNWPHCCRALRWTW